MTARVVFLLTMNSKAPNKFVDDFLKIYFVEYTQRETKIPLQEYVETRGTTVRCTERRHVQSSLHGQQTTVRKHARYALQVQTTQLPSLIVWGY